MATVYYPQFSTYRITATGERVVVASATIICYNVTTSSALASIASDADGIVASGSFTATAGDVVRFSHATYPLTFQLTLTATQAGAYVHVDNKIVTYIMQNLASLPEAARAELWAQDMSDLGVRPYKIGEGDKDSTVDIPIQTNVAKTLRIYPISITSHGSKVRTHFDTTNYEDIAIPAINTGAWAGDTITILQGGTGQTTKAAAFNALHPMTTLGDTIYEDSVPQAARLAGNITTTKKFYTQTGTGAASAAPAWAAIEATDVASVTTLFPTSLFKRYADATTTGTGSQNLYTNSIPAATLVVDGDEIKAEYAGIFAATADVKHLIVKFAATQIFASSQFDDIVSNTKHWRLSITIIRVSNTVVRSCVTLHTTDYLPWTKYLEITSLNLTTTAYNLDLDAQTDVAGGLTATMGSGVKVPEVSHA